MNNLFTSYMIEVVVVEHQNNRLVEYEKKIGKLCLI